MLNGWEILDTAVKIGLGAIIGGISTYYVSKLTHDKEMEKERRRRRRELLEEVASKCDSFARQVRDYWALMADWLDAKNPKKELPEHKKKILNSQQKFYDSFHDLTSAEGRLLLLGEKAAQEKLRSYGKQAQEFYAKVHLNSSGIDTKEMEEYRNRLRAHHETFFELLSDIYSRS